MSELLNSLTSDNLVLLCVIMGVIALFLAIAISIEIYNNNKRFKLLIDEDKKEDKEDTVEEVKVVKNINIKKDDNIKYVDEDSELEKTKAKMELASLRERLRKEEEEKNKLLEMNLALSANKKQEKKEEKIVEVVTTPPANVDEPTIELKIVNKEDKLDETLKKLRVVKEEKVEESVTTPPVEPKKEEIEFLDMDYPDDEDTAIISYDELKNANKFGYTDEEMNKYVDEEDAIISIQELENLYKESLNIEVDPEPPKIEFEMKRVEDLPEISDQKKFQSSPFISPVYGMTRSESELVLEQTANLEKLNEEIRKTNEFLKTLKDLKKNLE